MDQSPTTDILLDVQQEITLVPVSPGIRFANFLIDVIAFYGLMFLVGILLGFLAYSNGGYDAGSGSFDLGGKAMEYLLSYAVYITYYTLVEGISKGRTLGKLATGTVVVREDGESITFKDAFLRSLCRIVPFEAFSAFGYRPWHDKWTNTLVIKRLG